MSIKQILILLIVMIMISNFVSAIQDNCSTNPDDYINFDGSVSQPTFNNQDYLSSFTCGASCTVEIITDGPWDLGAEWMGFKIYDSGSSYVTLPLIIHSAFSTTHWSINDPGGVGYVSTGILNGAVSSKTYFDGSNNFLVMSGASTYNNNLATTNAPYRLTWGGTFPSASFDGANVEIYVYSGDSCPVSEPPPSADTCTYDSGDWIINMSDNCFINDTTDIGANDIIFQQGTGAGSLTINATITAEQVTFLPEGTIAYSVNILKGGSNLGELTIRGT